MCQGILEFLSEAGFLNLWTDRNSTRNGQIAQLVEQRTENPRVGGSIPSLATIFHYSFPANPSRLITVFPFTVTPK